VHSLVLCAAGISTGGRGISAIGGAPPPGPFGPGFTFCGVAACSYACAAEALLFKAVSGVVRLCRLSQLKQSENITRSVKRRLAGMLSQSKLALTGTDTPLIRKFTRSLPRKDS
jgi:hypothetical protein